MARDLDACCSILRAWVPEIIEHWKSGGDDSELRIIQAERSAREQEDLYAQGRTKPGKIVTNADGVTRLSRHQKQVLHGEDAVHAVDFGVFLLPGGEYVTASKYYRTLKSLIMDSGLEPSSAQWDMDHAQCYVHELD